MDELDQKTNSRDELAEYLETSQGIRKLKKFNKDSPDWALKFIKEFKNAK